MDSCKILALNPLSAVHYLDHLGVIAAIMGIPFLMTDPEQFKLARHYYPNLEARLEEKERVNAESIVSQYDTLFLSDYYADTPIGDYFRAAEVTYRKKLRIVHCPHGFSDKSYYLYRCAYEEMSLIYGQHMLDLFYEKNLTLKANSFVITGNYRYCYFKEYREFYRKIIENEILDHFTKQQPLILYAPTWNDSSGLTTFFSAITTILDRLPDEYNIIVKLHPNLERHHISLVYQIITAYEHKHNVLFLSRYPIVYPILQHCDIYLGDFSAVGYDFLAFNKPLFFLQERPPDLMPYLHRCGHIINASEYHQLYDLIEKNLPFDQERFEKIRLETYHYTFGEEKSFLELKNEISAIL